ncbi:MAG: hypothetical protein HRU75_05230 [Planctomycetia bacterium]|nr:MAG: hypothetical protein HRU75_05230 [Planctomycetia bacterium]
MPDFTCPSLAERVRCFAVDRPSALARLIRTPADARIALEAILARAVEAGPSHLHPPTAALERLYVAIVNYGAGRIDARTDLSALLASAQRELEALPDHVVRWDRELLAAIVHAAPQVFPLLIAPEVEASPAPRAWQIAPAAVAPVGIAPPSIASTKGSWSEAHALVV